MELTTTYILSQVFTILMLILFAMTYYSKDRKKILILDVLSITANMVAFILLNAWSGFAMNVVALIRNLIFMLDEKKFGNTQSIKVKDVIILNILYAILIIFAAFTYDGFFSLFSVFATMLYTYSVWQKKTIVYKVIGIPVGILWILYNIYIMSLFGIISQSILLMCSTNGFILETNKMERRSNKNILQKA